jgi:hypothetical protein
MSENRSVPDMSERAVLYHREASGMGMGLTKSLAKSSGACRDAVKIDHNQWAESEQISRLGDGGQCCLHPGGWLTCAVCGVGVSGAVGSPDGAGDG